METPTVLPRRSRLRRWILSPLGVAIGLLLIIGITWLLSSTDGQKFVINFLDPVFDTVHEETITPLPSYTPSMTPTASRTPQPAPATLHPIQITGTVAANTLNQVRDDAATAQVLANNAQIEATRAVENRDEALQAAEEAQGTAFAAYDVVLTAESNMAYYVERNAAIAVTMETMIQPTGTAAVAAMNQSQELAVTAMAFATDAFTEAQSQFAAGYGRNQEATLPIMLRAFNDPGQYSPFVFREFGTTNLISYETKVVGVPDVQLREGIFAVESTTMADYQRDEDGNDRPLTMVQFCGVDFELIAEEGKAAVHVIDIHSGDKSYIVDRLSEANITVLGIVRITEAMVSDDILDMSVELPSGARERTRIFIILDIHPNNVQCAANGNIYGDRPSNTAIWNTNSFYLRDSNLLVIDSRVEERNYAGG